MADDADLLLPFGISADTGEPLPGLADASVAAFLNDEREPSPESQAAAERGSPAGAAFAVEGDLDPDDLAQVGWGVVFGPGTDQAIKDALQPLLDHRKAQGAEPFVLLDEDGYRPGETALAWLKRRGTRLDVVDPAKGIPFYLLIVAPPDVIPFEFQYTLDLYWAVGRLWFDTPAEFARYAESVVRYETTAAVPTTRQLALFAPEHDFDAATQLFNRQVATPMRDGEGARPVPVGQRQKFALRPFVGEDARKETLARILRGDIPGGRPSLLFSGGHGMAFAHGDPLQEAAQGALVCSDWDRGRKIGADDWFAASDLADDAQVHGLIHFMFACYGGAVPQFDNFDRQNGAPKEIAPRPFLSRLPRALLSHAGGGALAVLAHVERAWAYSFQSDRGGAQIQGFRDVIGRLLRGERIGQATDTFNMRWAAITTEIAERQLDLQHGVEVPLKQLGQLWVARDDARNFMILGDPAVRLRVDDMPVLA